MIQESCVDNPQKQITLPKNMMQKLWDLSQNSSSDRFIDNISFYCSAFCTLSPQYDSFVSKSSATMNSSFDLSKITFTLNIDNDIVEISIPTERVAPDEVESFLFGKINFWELINRYTNANCANANQLSTDQVFACFGSWNRYINQLGYSEETNLLNFDDSIIRDNLRNNSVVWYYGSSCSGKTYMALRELSILESIKIVYNPCFSDESDFDLIKILLCCGKNMSFLLDDLQCDQEKARELFELIASLKESFSERNIHIILISWASLIKEGFFSSYHTLFCALESNIERYIAHLQERIQDKTLLKVCGSNIALLNTASGIESSNNPEKALFDSYIKTTDYNKLPVLYELCVLGTYEYLVEETTVKMSILSSDISTLKLIGKKYYVGHKEICRFLSMYMLHHQTELLPNNLPSQDKIIFDYIQKLEVKKDGKQ